jgi:hypothetical protein
MLLAGLAYVAWYGSNVPSWDEWDMVPTFTGEQPVTWSWLWSQHSEHRIPVPRLVMLALNRPLGCDFRICMYFNVALMGALALVAVFVARRVRGRVRYADAFLPLVLLNGSHGVNFLWGWEVCFFVPTFLAVVVLLVMVRSGPRLTPTATAIAAVCLALLVGCEAHGVALVPLLALWLGFAGWLAWRSRAPGARRDGLVLLGLASVALLLVGLYFVGYEPVPHHPSYRGLRATVRIGLKFLTLGLGTAPLEWWPWSGLVVLGVLGLSTTVLAAVVWQRPAERLRALGLLLFLGALAVLAAALGVGRDRADPRYVILAVPAWCGVYFAWELYGPWRTGRLATLGLFAVACLALWPNSRFGLNYARDLRSRLGSWERDMADGVPAYALVHRYGADLHIDQKVPTDYMPLLRRAGVGNFTLLRDNPRFREVPIPPGSAVMYEARREAGGTYVTDAFSTLVFTLPRERFVCGIRLKYRHSNEKGTLPFLSLHWKGAGQTDYPPEQCWKQSPTGDRLNWERGTWLRRDDPEPTMLVWVVDRVNEIRLHPDYIPGTFTVVELVLLVPEGEE